MPIDYRDYDPEWNNIRARILKRAGNRCEACGAINGCPHPVTASMVVLTIAHLDHDVSNNDDGNLKALCQRCHLAHDREQHRANAAATRRRRREQAGQSPAPAPQIAAPAVPDTKAEAPRATRAAREARPMDLCRCGRPKPVGHKECHSCVMKRGAAHRRARSGYGDPLDDDVPIPDTQIAGLDV